MNLTLSESRGEEADKLDITLDDSDGRLPMPGKGSKIALKLGWAGHGLVDKGTYEVDEVEHQGVIGNVSCLWQTVHSFGDFD